MFTIVEEPRHLLHVVRTGVWTTAVAARYRVALGRALMGRDPADPPLFLLIDIAAASTIPREAMDEMAGAAEAIGRSAIRRIAVVGDSAVARMQAKRLLASRAAFASFDAVADARAWLLADAAPPVEPPRPD